MRERDILALASRMGLYDKKLEFVEISPQELVEFAYEISSKAVDDAVTKIKHALDKL